MTSRRMTDHERRRRASIARRYTAIASPTREDDEAFAKELGLSVDSLWRLARAWRLGVVDEASAEDQTAARARALDAAREPDLSGVSPSRRPLMEERLKVIARHLEIPASTPADLMTAATSLDLTVASFRRLLRGWIRHRNPALLPGGSSPMRNTRYQRKVLASCEQQMAQALTNLGTQVSSMALHREVVRLCEVDGVKPPVQTTVYARLMRARSEASMDDGEPGFVVDHSAVNLTVHPPEGGDPTIAVLSMLFCSRSGRIVTHSLSLDPPSPGRTAALLSVGTSKLPPGSEQLTMRIPAQPEWQALTDALVARGVTVSVTSSKRMTAGKLATRRFGDLIGPLRMRPRHTRSPRTARLTRVMGAGDPLTLSEALLAIEDAVRRHNSERAEPTVGFVPTTGSMVIP